MEEKVVPDGAGRGEGVLLGDGLMKMITGWEMQKSNIKMKNDILKFKNKWFDLVKKTMVNLWGT